jgi:hypothetical protein
MAFVIPVRTFVLVGWGDRSNLLNDGHACCTGARLSFDLAAGLRLSSRLRLGYLWLCHWHCRGCYHDPYRYCLCCHLDCCRRLPVGFANWVSSLISSMELGVVCEGLFDGGEVIICRPLDRSFFSHPSGLDSRRMCKSCCVTRAHAG